MFHLSREVRFAINAVPDDQLAGKPSNSYGGYPSQTGLGSYLAFRVTLAGELEPRNQYLVNIKQIDAAIRDRLGEIEDQVRGRAAGPARILALMYAAALARWPKQLDSLALSLTPLLTLSLSRSEHPMLRLSQKFEFSASHRLHSPGLSDEENRKTFGKCNNPLGHGHNYEVQVTLIGTPDDSGLLVDIPAFERVVAETVIERFDHRNLNVEIPEFRQIIPSVENIAKVVYELLKPKLKSERAKLASVTVWETPKTWCEYSE